MDFFEKQLTSETVYQGKIVNVRSDTVELTNGAVCPREVVEHPGGVAVVALTPDGAVVMVRQYRYSVSDELLEIPAGKLEYGEQPLSCAVRELSEETGYSAGSIVDLGAIYPSPGFSQETLYLYLATELTAGEMHLDENELLNVERIPLDALVGQIMDGDIKDAKTIIGILKVNEYLKTTR